MQKSIPIAETTFILYTLCVHCMFTCYNPSGDVHLIYRSGKSCCDHSQRDQESSNHHNWLEAKTVA